MIDLYELLGVKRDASKEEIKLAYKKLVKKYHPDVNRNDDANKIIRNLNEAKETLLDDEKRREYDINLNNINNSKEFSKDKSETYSTKNEEYKKEYSDVYVTRWEFFVHYFKNSVDKIFKKIFKSVLVSFNYLFFLVIRMVIYLFMYVIFLMQDLVDFIAGLLIIIALLCLFNIALKTGNQVFSFIPYNVQNFCFYSLSGIITELIKLYCVNGNVNIFRRIQKIHDKIFIWILNKL